MHSARRARWLCMVQFYVYSFSYLLLSDSCPTRCGMMSHARIPLHMGSKAVKRHHLRRHPVPLPKHSHLRSSLGAHLPTPWSTRKASTHRGSIVLRIDKASVLDTETDRQRFQRKKAPRQRTTWNLGIDPSGFGGPGWSMRSKAPDHSSSVSTQLQVLGYSSCLGIDHLPGILLHFEKVIQATETLYITLPLNVVKRHGDDLYHPNSGHSLCSHMQSSTVGIP